MRTKLQEIDGQRVRFKAKVLKFGTRRVLQIPTVLLERVIIADSGEMATDHVWLSARNILGTIQPGSIVEFDARVRPYEKGYFNPRKGINNRRIDYELVYPTALNVLDVTEADAIGFQQLELMLGGLQ
jgi:hypothetical protein